VPEKVVPIIRKLGIDPTTTTGSEKYKVNFIVSRWAFP
jgi:hypothetical protein